MTETELDVASTSFVDFHERFFYIIVLFLLYTRDNRDMNEILDLGMSN